MAFLRLPREEDVLEEYRLATVDEVHGAIIQKNFQFELAKTEVLRLKDGYLEATSPDDFKLRKRFTYREEDLRDKIEQKLAIRTSSTSSGISLILTARSLFVAFNFRMDAEILLECYLSRLVGVLHRNEVRCSYCPSVRM